MRRERGFRQTSEVSCERATMCFIQTGYTPVYGGNFPPKPSEFPRSNSCKQTKRSLGLTSPHRPSFAPRSLGVCWMNHCEQLTLNKQAAVSRHFLRRHSTAVKLKILTFINKFVIDRLCCWRKLFQGKHGVRRISMRVSRLKQRNFETNIAGARSHLSPNCITL